MSPREIIFRLVNGWQSAAEYYIREFWRPETCRAPGTFRAIPFFRNVSRDILEQLPADFERQVKAAVGGKLEFGGKKYQLATPIPWHQDYETGITLPLMHGRKFFKLSLYDYPADIFYLRTISRHTYLVFVAVFAGVTGKHIHYLKSTLSDWIDSNPYLEGINWSEVWQVGARLINWCILLSFIYDHIKDDTDFMIRIGTAMVQQATFIRQHPALYSSANNHLMCELISMSFVCAVFPDSNFARKHNQAITQELAEQVRLQYHTDGFHREQSFHYQCYTLEYLLLLLRTWESLNLEIDPFIRNTIEKGLDALAQLVPEKGPVHSFGDGGYYRYTDIFYRFCNTVSFWDSLLNHGALYFNHPEWLRGGSIDPRTVLMYGGHIPKIEQERDEQPQKRLLRECGYLVLEGNSSTGISIRVIFDAGPFGYPPTYAHAHADALSFTLDINDMDFLIDPGTFDYHPKEKKWRDYFRGTYAHNTVVVDGEHQACPGGDMLWLSPPNIKTVEIQQEADVSRVFAEHDGYQRLRDSVIHHRALMLYHERGEIEVLDTLRCRGAHQVIQCFHFAFECNVRQISPREMRIEREGLQLTLKLDEMTEVRIYNGNEDMPAGWFSPEAGVKIPCYSIFASCKIAETTTLRSFISISSKSGVN